MAFEYLMAYYLLTRRIDKMVANLHRFDDFDQARLTAALRGSDRDPSGGRPARKRSIWAGARSVRKRGGAAANSCRLLGRFQGNPSAAFAALHPRLWRQLFLFLRVWAQRPAVRTGEAVTMKQTAPSMGSCPSASWRSPGSSACS